MRRRTLNLPSLPIPPVALPRKGRRHPEKGPLRDVAEIRVPGGPSRIDPADADPLAGNTLPTVLAVEDGALAVQTRADFDALSYRDDVPGALGVRQIKFVILGLRGTPRLYYMNSQTHELHYYFARDVLGLALDIPTFNRLAYFDEHRDFLVGSVILHETFPWPDGSAGLYAIEFWPSDVIPADQAVTAYAMVADTMPFARGSLAYHPAGMGQQERAAEEARIFEAAQVPVVLSEDIFASVSFAPLNLGHTFGRLRLIDGSAPRPPAATGIAIFRQLPNDLARIAGVISEAPQTPLSHVNLRAQQNDIPNAYLRDAHLHPDIADHLDEIVRFEVTADALHIHPATRAEMEAFHASRRPAVVQSPVRDLSRSTIQPLSALGHADHTAYGAKAANLAELGHLLGPEIVPQGFAVPYYFYHRFMEENDLYDAARVMMAEDAFRDDEAALKAFRKVIKEEATMPPALYDALGVLQGRFPPHITPRCRSSANAEDMDGFSGAGLYDSYTHREDEGHIEKSIRQVWASLWTFRAFEEREFWRIEHLDCAMGVLVHPNFDDEAANGVAITKNLYYETFPGYYINVQLGEDRVTNPELEAVAEEMLVMENRGLQTIHPFVTIRVRNSNLTGGAPVMRNHEVAALVNALARIHAHFRPIYGAEGDDSFAMDVEFKLDSTRKLAIKQARPWRGLGAENPT